MEASEARAAVAVNGSDQEQSVGWRRRENWSSARFRRERPQAGNLREAHLPDFTKDAPEFWLRSKAHGSIRAQEGQPTYFNDLME